MKIRYGVSTLFALGECFGNLVRIIQPSRVHTHDNNGRQDQHLAVGAGNVDWKECAALLRENNFNGTVVVESVRLLSQVCPRFESF